MAKGGIDTSKMMKFLALTVYMGLVKQEHIKAYSEYWSTDAVLATPFVRSVTSRDDFLQIMTFLHCCDNATYPARNEEGYDLRKKLGKVFTVLTDAFPRISYLDT